MNRRLFLFSPLLLIGCNVLNAQDFPNLQTALNAAAGGKLQIPHGTYSINSALVIPSNITIGTDGPVIISSSANAPILDLTGKSNVRIEGHLILQGNGAAYNGYPSSQVVDNGQIGIKISGADQIFIDRLEIRNIAGSGIDYQLSPAWQSVVQIRDFCIHDCYKGVHCWNTGEYAQFSGGNINNCLFGYHVESGNNSFDSCKAVYCSIGVKLSGGANNAHGIFSGFISDHNTYNLVCQDITLGETFSGCHFIGGQAGADQGCIQILNSKGISFSGGQMAYSDLNIDATSQVGMRDITLRGPVNVTYATGALFDAKNQIVIPGAALILNGSAWGGNN